MQAWPRRIVRVHLGSALCLGLVVGVCASVFGSPWLAVSGLGVGALYFALATRRYRARRHLLAEPFSAAWRTALETRVAFYARLDAEARRRFEDDVRIFLAEQRIYGAHGAKVDDETRLLVAASAAMLGHGLPEWEWPSLRDIVVYPRAFDADYRPRADGNTLGMVHAQGPILFSQTALKHGFSRAKDGDNVGLHELAHVMDFGDGRADGIPADLDWVATAPWIGVVADRLKKLRRRRYRALRDYAGTNEAELFAVAVEAFFERPEELHGRDPELYALLADYFNQDPKRAAATPSGTSSSDKLTR